MAQRDVGADKLLGMRKNAMKRWNNFKALPLSGDSEELLEKCEGVPQKYPKLLLVTGDCRLHGSAQEMASNSRFPI